VKIAHIVFTFIASAALVLVVSAPAQAMPIPVGQSVSYDIDVLDANGTTAPTVYATVNLTQGDGTVSFIVTPTGTVFANTGGPHFEFAFNLATAFNDASVELTGANAGDFQVMSGSSFKQAPFGYFGHAIDFVSGIGTGTSANYGTPLTFTVSQANLNIENFIANQNGFLFAADLGKNGVTQNVAAVPGNNAIIDVIQDGGGATNGGEVPEPATLTLVGAGLLALATRKRKA
jgi:hypothetical protein